MKKTCTYLFIILIIVSTNVSIFAKSSTTIENLSSYFVGYTGTFVMYDWRKDSYYIYNEEQSETRLSPCSTFKIANSLIGLETGVVKDEDSMIEWDGSAYPMQSWNKNHSLSSAISNSVVWYYQIVAQRIGEDRMKENLALLEYGNEDISGGISQFWLASSLKISAKEQVDFMKRLYFYQLPFNKNNIDIVKKIIRLYHNNSIVFSGKTGSGVINDKAKLGWFIGYLEKDNNVYFFATNIRGVDIANGYLAREITQSILRSKNLINFDN